MTRVCEKGEGRTVFDNYIEGQGFFEYKSKMILNFGGKGLGTAESLNGKLLIYIW